MKTEFDPAESFACEAGPVSAEYDTDSKRLVVEMHIGNSDSKLRLELSPAVAFNLDQALARLRAMHGTLGTSEPGTKR